MIFTILGFSVSKEFAFFSALGAEQENKSNKTNIAQNETFKRIKYIAQNLNLSILIYFSTVKRNNFV